MFQLIKKFLQQRALKSNKSKVETQIMPLSKVKTAITFMDAQEADFSVCKNKIISFYKENNIKGEIFFFDFRKISNEELLITSIQNTILKKDLNWFGKPNNEKINIMNSYKPDLFISLIKGANFPLEYMVSCSNAKFKVGRTRLKNKIYDLIISENKDKELNQIQFFEEVIKYLKLIKN